MYNPRTDGVTMSVLTTYRNCPTKARMMLNGYYVPGNSAALIYGNVYHEAMDICLNMIKQENIECPEDFSPEKINKIIIKLNKHFSEEFNESEAKFKEEFIISFEVMRYLIPEYFKFWNEDFFGENKKKYTQIEEVFRTGFAGSFLMGKKDGVYEDEKGNGWLLEHKTKSVIKEDALSMTIARDFQVNLYMLAHYLSEGTKLKGVLYNVVRKSALRRKSSESMTEYAARIGNDIKDRPEFYFVRYHVKIDFEYISAFSRRLYREVQEFLKWWESDPKIDAEYTHNCSAIYGVCPYIIYCDSGRSNLDGLQKKELFEELKTKK